MENQKIVDAKIFNPINDEFMYDISLTITKEDSITGRTKSNELPKYKVVGRILDSTLQLEGNSYILEITPELRGSARFDKIVGSTHWLTDYLIDLEDSIWMNDEWFDNIYII